MEKSGFLILNQGEHSVGLIDNNGNVILPCIYDKIPDFDNDGYIRFIKGEYTGTIDLKGNEVIPLSFELTHLGVFHNGTARACKNGNWGLVDEKGKDVTGFIFKTINAHYKNGYIATTNNNVKGWLSEDGHFKEFKNHITKNKYKDIRTYRNGIAPAYTYDNKWVFIDKALNRINNNEYWYMDPVLRDGIYNVGKSPREHSIASYDGTLIINEWFDYKLKFEAGFAICSKKRKDKFGNDIINAMGQPEFFYGIIKPNGEYLFPLIFENLCWTDYKAKNSWLAKMNGADYLLMPDGRKFLIKGEHLYEIKEKDGIYPQTELYYERKISHFNYELFESKLKEWTDDRLNFYYRDTDAEVDIKRIYKKGTVLRAGRFIEVTDKLKRPVCKTRFLIVSHPLLSKSQLEDRQITIPIDKDFRGYLIHPDACFIVYDVQKISGVTQIVLLNLPSKALQLANKVGFKMSKFKPLMPDCTPLKQATYDDLVINSSSYVHGYSLSDYWTQVMAQPVGINTENIPYDWCKNYPGQINREHSGFYQALGSITVGNDYDWYEHSFTKPSGNSFRIVIGNILALHVDVMVNMLERHIKGNIGANSIIFDMAGPELIEEYNSLGKIKIGESKITNAYNLPQRKVIHSIIPTWDGTKKKNELLASSYISAMDLAINNKYLSIAFPCLFSNYSDDMFIQAAKIAIDNLYRYMISSNTIDITICCQNENEALIIKDLLLTNMYHNQSK